MEEDPIQVHCRIKPSTAVPSFLRVDHSNGMVWADASHSCRFHHVFGPEASQRHVFEQTALPLLESVCKGFNATLLAYGQTGSGKTHTICGDLVGDSQGIIPRVAQVSFVLRQSRSVFIAQSPSLGLPVLVGPIGSEQAGPSPIQCPRSLPGRTVRLVLQDAKRLQTDHP